MADMDRIERNILNGRSAFRWRDESSPFYKAAYDRALCAALLTVFLFSVFRYTGLSAAGRSVHMGTKQPVVVIDAGHGAMIRERWG